MEVKDPSYGNNQEYKSQICCHLDRTDNCQWFNIATAICEACVGFHSLTGKLGPENNNNCLSENPEKEDPTSITSTTGNLLMQIWPAASITGTIQ